MSDRQTAKNARSFYKAKEPLDLYQTRAQEALPLLVRQAWSGRNGTPIVYSDLAQEMGIPNERNLNYPLGSVGNTLIELGREWKEDIPPLQCLVINKRTRMPGLGFDFFMDKEGRKLLSRRQRKAKVNALIGQIAAYPYWDRVLIELGLQKASQIDPNLADLMRQAAQRGQGAGEGEEHRRLKMFVKENPSVVNVNENCHSVTEHSLTSGDRLDVLFTKKDLIVAVEVKSHISDEADLMRGLFQCVKYQAVLEAELRSNFAVSEVRTVLVSTRELTPRVLKVKNILGVEFIQLPQFHA